jgi:hypothetical protein
MAPAVTEVRPLLVNGPTAARLLAVSGRTLFDLTEPRGLLPCLRIGRSVRYRVIDLENFVARRVAESAAMAAPDVQGVSSHDEV